MLSDYVRENPVNYEFLSPDWVEQCKQSFATVLETALYQKAEAENLLRQRKETAGERQNCKENATRVPLDSKPNYKARAKGDQKKILKSENANKSSRNFKGKKVC